MVDGRRVMELSTILIIILFLLLGIVIGNFIGAMKRDNYWNNQIPIHRQEAISQSRAVLGGQFSEQLAPYLPDFPFSPTEVRFLGKPIDFVVFKGSDNKEIEEVVFVEVKSGKSKISPVEKSLKKTIEKKKVSWQEYRIPDDVTNKKEYI